jgi:hypothetical protein
MARAQEPIEPMTLENMRHNGVKSLSATNAGTAVIMNVDHLPGDLTVS